MSYLLDTNILIRLANKSDSQRGIILDCLGKIRANGQAIYFTPQILSEFWNVCTWPIEARGGLGLTVEQAERKASLIEKHFLLATDNLRTFYEWRRLISEYKVTGVQVHDAKIVSSMIVHGIDFLVTFNKKDFARFDRINALPPNEI